MKIFWTLSLLALAILSNEPEKHVFQAEVSRLLDIIINSLYSQKEVFLREAISNASDALDKIRFLGVKDPKLLEVNPELAIRIKIDKENEKLIIEDSGIGMTKNDLINNLGTIARSGTTQFLEAISKQGNLNLIGQFGVGFYSYFLVASQVEVITKNTEDDQYIWKSSAGATFTIEKDIDGPSIKRGTRIILTMKKDASEFLDIQKIKNLIKKYSEFINFPIYLYTSKEVEKEVEEEEKTDETSKKDETEEKKDDLEIKDEDSDKKVTEKETKKKKVKETVWDWEQTNENKAIWLRPIEEIEDEEYNKFYKTVSKDYQDPLTWIHFKAEGEIEFTALLYIPKKQPFSWMDQEEDKENKSNLKLYVRRVLISEDFKELMPRWLSFVKGVVDSDDLPLNVSRESLQQLRALKTIKKKLIAKVIGKLEKMSKQTIEDDEKENEEELTEEEKLQKKEKKEKRKQEIKEKYEKFWNEFGKSIKLGIIDDSTNRDKLAELLLYKSTFNDTNTLVSLNDYNSRKKENQKEIYYLGGDNAKQMLESAMVKAMQKRGYEVLLLDQPIDEYCIQQLRNYSELKLSNIGKAGFELPIDEEEKANQRKLTKYFDPLISWLQKTLPNSPAVKINPILTGQPLIVLASESGYSAHMEKIARAQAVTQNDDRMSMFENSKKNVEINPSHPFIQELLEKVKAGPDKDTEDVALLLYEMGLMNSGYVLSDTSKFSSRFFKVVSDSLGISRTLEEKEVDVSTIEDTGEAKEEKKEDSEMPNFDQFKAEEGSDEKGEDDHNHDHDHDHDHDHKHDDNTEL